jgi:SAM-dependent methyltransferase
MKIIFVLSRLWRYLNIYFLKPFDAVNDTLTASLLKEHNWSTPFVEVGSGDGMFGYIMHGGKFPLWFDRYVSVDLKKKDIFDTLNEKANLNLKKINNFKNLHSIDAKKSHVEKIKEIGFAENAILSDYEKLPFEDNSFDSIFLYTPHGLKNYQLCVEECFRILKSKGRLVVLNYDKSIEKNFLSYNLSKKFIGNWSNYFKSIDNGRFEEITKLSKTLEDWNNFFNDIGFEVVHFNKGLSSTAWKVYDIQTRPFLKILIKFFNYLPRYIRTLFKLIWMLFWFPIIVLFYLIFSNQYFKLKYNCYYSFNLEKQPKL